MKCCAPVILTAVLLATAGCEEPSSPGGKISPSPNSSAPDPATSRALLSAPDSPAGPGKTVYLIHLQLATVEVPLGVASGSEELWSVLDEEPVSLRSRVLGMNGFRVGLGRREDWDDIERVLKEMTGQSFRSTTVQAPAGQPTPVELQSRQPTRLLFVTREDQTLYGEHVPPGDYLLTLTCTLDEDDPSRVLITAVPQVRSTKRPLQMVHEHGSTVLVQRPVIRTLRSMAFQLTVPNNDFLIIGPGVLARRPTSPGQAFLTRMKKSVPFETVILLRPMVHAVQLNSAPPTNSK